MSETKIAIFIYSMAAGGAERVTSYLLPHLIQKGHTVVLVLMNETVAYDIPENVKIHYLEKSRGDEAGLIKLLKLPFLAFKYARWLKKEKVTHSMSLLTRPSYVNIMARWLTKHKYKLLISERSYPSMQYGYKNFQSIINNFLIRKLYPKADIIICNSQGNANDLIQNYTIKKNKIIVIPNPVDLNRIAQIKPNFLPFDQNKFNIITVGRMDEGKNHQLLIKSIVPYQKVHLFIIGNGVLRNDLERLCVQENIDDRVHFLGFQKNPFQFLKAADLFLFGSNHEGFPNVILEAMCCGLPIVSTNCKSGPDEMLELKEEKTDDLMFTDYGILVPVNHIELMQKALAHVLAHPEFLEACKPRLSQRIKAYAREPIVEAYRQHILA